MSDSEDDFVEVNYQSSSDSDWEKIDPSEDEFEIAHDGPLASRSQVRGNVLDAASPKSPIPSSHKTKRPSRAPRRRGKKHWTKMVPVQDKGVITPQDCVQSLGITVEVASLLAHYSLFTIGQLACFDVISKLSYDDPNFGKLLDLAEQACAICTEYVTKVSSTSILWGYYYLGEAALTQVLQNGYLESEEVLFLWEPMPLQLYYTSLAIDRIVGRDTNNPSISDRYSRVIKINLTSLCEDYGANLYQKNKNSWFHIRLTEVDAWKAVDDMWTTFEPGTDVFSSVLHGKIVSPAGKIPVDCMEFDSARVPRNLAESTEELEGGDHPLSRFLVQDTPVSLGRATKKANYNYSMA